MKTSLLQIRISPDLKASLKDAAGNEGLSVSAYVTRVLTLKLKNEKDNT